MTRHAAGNRPAQVQLGVKLLGPDHFHLLVRVPHRPDGFDVSLEVFNGLSGDAATAGTRESDNVLHMQAANATAFKQAKPGHYSNYNESIAETVNLLGKPLSPRASRESEKILAE